MEPTKVYDDSIVIEVKSPTQKLVDKGFGGNGKRRTSVKEFKKGFDSPREYSAKLNEKREFIVPKKYEGVELKNIIGVWDKEKFNYPHFMSFSKFVNLMRDEFPDRMPNKSTNNSISEEKHALESKVRKFVKDNKAAKNLIKMNDVDMEECFKNFYNAIYNCKGFKLPNVGASRNQSRAKMSMIRFYKFLSIVVSWNKLYIKSQDYLGESHEWVSLNQLLLNRDTSLKMLQTAQGAKKWEFSIVKKVIREGIDFEEAKKIINSELEKRFFEDMNAIKADQRTVEAVVKNQLLNDQDLGPGEEKKLIKNLEALLDNEICRNDIEFDWLRSEKTKFSK
jgi:hypothetical protein